MIRLLLLLVAFVASGCASSGYHAVTPTPIAVAPPDLGEARLLDVGVALTETPELSARELEKQGTHSDIRAAERIFVPYHLRRTLNQSGFWGSVQVVPPEVPHVDLKVTSELVESNGERMRLAVTATDASGRVWLERKYESEIDGTDYTDTVPGEHEAFQDLYNTVANDLSSFVRALTPEEIEEIRTVSELAFAGAFAPDAYGGHLAEVDGRIVVQRLPAAGDPIMDRIERIRARDHMFNETLDQYYEGCYTNMWEAYENWRRFNLAERVALRELEQDAFTRTLTGILMIAAAVVLEVADVPNTNTVRDVLVLGGGQVVISGVNVSEQKEIHAAAIEELSNSFGAEMRPTIVELEGKQYELTGTAQEQYDRWRALLQRVYAAETGFDVDPESLEADAPALPETPDASDVSGAPDPTTP
ncbi:MAG: hypothetical protein HKN62_05465 [Phycisphaerales bacterium]|nr:hypothetical protein [Phycisphaerales bacterium]